MKLLRNDKLEVNLSELEIRVEGDEWKAGMDRSFKKNAPRLNIPGFRKGKAPRAMVMKMVGESYFYEDAVNMTYSEAYEAALAESGLEPVDRADVDLKEVSSEGYTFTARVTTRPEVTLGEYKGLAGVRPYSAVTEEELQGELDRMAERNSRLIDVDDRPAENGDTTQIDFEGFLDGAPFPGGKGEKYTLVLGSNQFIPGFEEQIVGHSVDEEFEINVTFPENYHEESLKGKDTTFKIKLLSIKKKEVPALDDEFAKDVSEFDTLDELKEDVRKRLQERKTAAAEDQLENALVEMAANGAQMEIPAVMIERKIDDMVQDFAYRLESQGLNMRDYLQYAGMDPAAFRDGFSAQAGQQVRVSLTLEAIAKAEDLQADPADVQKEYEKMAEAYNLTPDKVKEVVAEESIIMNLRLNKAIDLIKSTAVVTDAPAEEPVEEPKAEKAPKAKKAAEKPSEEAPKEKAPKKRRTAKAKAAEEAAEAPKDGE